MKITLWKLRSERNVVDKSLKISPSDPYEIEGTFRDDVDIVHPSILIQYDGVVTFNYIRIVEMDRYYFVDNVTYVRTGLIRIDCTVDVLFTFKAYILEQSAIIARYQEDENPLLIDNKRPLSTETDFNIQYWGTSNPFDVATPIAVGQSMYNIILMVSNNITNPYDTYVAPGTSQGVVLPDSRYIPGTVTAYAMTTNGAEQLINWASVTTSTIFSSKPLSDNIVGVFAYPFDCRPTSGEAEEIKLGNTASGTFGYRLKNKNDLSKVFDFGQYICPYTNDTFANFEPYLKCQIYLPYIGFKNITMHNLNRTTSGVKLKYVVDLQTGVCQAVVYDGVNASNKILLESGVIGVQIPVSSSNIGEKLTNTINYITSSAVSLAMLTNPTTSGVGLAGLVNNGIGLMGNDLVVRGSIPSTELSRFIPQRPQVYYQKQRVLLPYNYGETYGYPCMMHHELSELNGFTIVDEIHLTNIGTANSTEYTMIEDLLKSGVIF